MSYPDVMVDIETTSTDPAHGAIIQIAAVKFDLDRNEVWPEFFYKSMKIPPNKFWDQGTMEFWGRNKLVFNRIMETADNPEVILKMFSDWVMTYNGGHVRLWASPATFEFPFLQQYFKDFRIASPFHYRSVIDLNSYISGLYNQTTTPKIDLPFEGSPHNAIDDALHQLRILFYAKSYANGVSRGPAPGQNLSCGSTAPQEGGPGKDGDGSVQEAAVGAETGNQSPCDTG